MTGTLYYCCNDQRRVALEAHPELNGIDFLEVADLLPTDLDPIELAEYNALPIGQRARLLWNRKLTIHFVNPLLQTHIGVLKQDNFRVEGGDKIRNIGVVPLAPLPAVGDETIVVKATKRGDFSIYRLRLVKSQDDPDPPDVFEPLQSAVDFSFRVDCPEDFDCADKEICPPEVKPQIDLDYLAKDYASFRRLILDRISALSPDWREKSPADLGVAMIETLAYVADYLSYRQDAIATEAYLGTARRRTSIRRHARLVDYFMHDGCNARVWMHVRADGSVPLTGIKLPRADAVTGVTTKFLTRVDATPVLSESTFAQIRSSQHPEVFEPLHDIILYPQHNEMDFYTWGGTQCCLPTGATRATLLGRFDNLKPGDVLIFVEVRGPHTGLPEDADPAHRHAVRLTDVKLTKDLLGGRFKAVPDGNPVDVTEIVWNEADALPFPLCLSAIGDAEHEKQPIDRVSVALGNIVLADHGLSVSETIAQRVPQAELWRALVAAGHCAARERVAIPARYNPALTQRPLTQKAPYDASNTVSANAATRWDLRGVLPAIRLEGKTGALNLEWSPVRDLLKSNANARNFIVEVEADLAANLRFGDDQHGQRPSPDTEFSAFYRVGNGLRGNVGANTIVHMVTNIAGIERVSNPLPARGGLEPESMEDVRRFAPDAFRTQERAVTTADYAMKTETHPQIQKAAATFRWTGSWRTVFVTPDPVAKKDPDQPFVPDLRAYLEPYRMAGHDLEIDMPRYVPLEIEMQVCAKSDYFKADVERAVKEILSARMLPDGRKGVFHPDNFTFGQSVYLSQLYAAAYAVEGAASAKIVIFQRQGVPDPLSLQEGKLVFDRLEIARLDNDRNYPERGVFKLSVAGGK